MRKRLIAIVLGLFVMAWLPLTAQAVSNEPVTFMQVSPGAGSESMQPGESSYALKAPSADAGKLIAIGAGSGGLFDSDPATVIAAGDSCGGCHSIKGDVPSGVHGGGTRVGITT